MPRPDEIEGPIRVPGNPIKMSKVPRGPETRIPWLGEHTTAVLSTELGLTVGELEQLRADGVIG